MTLYSNVMLIYIKCSIYVICTLIGIWNCVFTTLIVLNRTHRFSNLPAIHQKHSNLLHPHKIQHPFHLIFPQRFGSDISTIHCFVESPITNAGTGNRQKRGLDIRLLPGSVQNLCELLREVSKLWRRGLFVFFFNIVWVMLLLRDTPPNVQSHCKLMDRMNGIDRIQMACPTL